MLNPFNNEVYLKIRVLFCIINWVSGIVRNLPALSACVLTVLGKYACNTL